MSTISSTSGRLHSEFIRLLFWLTHRETDCFFETSGVQLTQQDRGLFHFFRAALLAHLKAKVGSTLTKVATLRINLNIDGVPITSRKHTHLSHSQISTYHTRRLSRHYPRQGCSFTYYNQYWWGAYHFKNTYSPITLENISSINLVFIFRCSSPPSNPVYGRRVDSWALVFSLSSHRHSYIGLGFTSRFIDS